MFLAIDQAGQVYRIAKHPRKELCQMLGVQHASKMYRDTADGPKHVGYVIGGHWLEVFDATPWRRPA
jgi:hypothetical protein